MKSRIGRISRLRRALAAASLIAALAAPSAARAEGEPRIVLVAPARDDRIALRIRAELKALHFEVLDEDAAPGPPAREPLQDAARRSDAIAAVRLVPSGAGIEVWIVDRMTGKTVLRELVVDASPSGGATVALQVVELLRASLMELDAPRPPPGEVPPPARVRELLAPPAPPPRPVAPDTPLRRPLLSLELGPALTASPGGLGPSGALAAGVHIRSSDPIGASLFALIPLLPARVSGPEGTARAQIGMVGAGLRSVFLLSEGRWTPSLGAGISVVWLGIDGDPAPGAAYRGSNSMLVTAAPYLRAGLGVAVAPRLRLRADLIGAATLARPVVKFGERVAAVWGAPFFAPSTSLELVW